MPDATYQSLSASSREEALTTAQEGSGFPPFLLEKDVWVVATLRALFDLPFAPHLTFKGGTSLSKAWHAIRRFSEDVDVTYDIRAIAPDLVAGTGDEALAPTRSQQERWTRKIRARLAEWVRDVASRGVEEGLARAGFVAPIRLDAHRLFVDYEPLFEATERVRSAVLVEFGARSTGEPRTVMPVECDAAAHLPNLVFPQARPTTMLAERTFWEKATATHVYCLQQRRRGRRLSRHWHDLARLDEAGIATRALGDRSLARSVARHKAVFFVENDTRGQRIDYQAAVSGHLKVVPTGKALDVLADDYTEMLGDRMLLGQSEPFDELMERCAAIEARANEV